MPSNSSGEVPGPSPSRLSDDQRNQLLRATIAFASTLGGDEDIYRWKLAAVWAGQRPWPVSEAELASILDELGLGKFRAESWGRAIGAVGDR